MGEIRTPPQDETNKGIDAQRGQCCLRALGFATTLWGHRRVLLAESKSDMFAPREISLILYEISKRSRR
jgi:hypothetical protein